MKITDGFDEVGDDINEQEFDEGVPTIPDSSSSPLVLLST